MMMIGSKIGKFLISGIMAQLKKCFSIQATFYKGRKMKNFIEKLKFVLIENLLMHHLT